MGIISKKSNHNALYIQNQKYMMRVNRERDREISVK